MYRRFVCQMAFLMNKAGDGDGGGGSGGSGDGKGAGDGKGGDGKGSGAGGGDEVAALRAANAALEARLAKLEGKSGGAGDDDEGDDEDLSDKARKMRAAEDKKGSDAKALEAALRFNMGAESWLKQNQSLLPKDISDIFKAAEKEKYDSAIEKDAAIKAGIIQSFFSVQANLDLLTPAIKGQLEDYLRLTKTGKQDKAQQMYDTIFEPAFEMLRRVKKAESLNKGFGGGGTAAEDAYKQKMMNLSKKHYLGEKSNA